MTMGSSFSPVALTKNAHVFLCLACFPPLQHRPFSFRLVSGKPRQKLPVSSTFHPSSGFHPRVMSLTHSFQLSIVSSFTSPSSPAMSMWCRLCCFLNDSSHPLEAAKPLMLILSAASKLLREAFFLRQECSSSCR